MSEARWVWLQPAVLLAVHDEQIAEHGGTGGVRDPALLEFVLAEPRRLDLEGEPDAAELAAAYAFGITRSRPFADGNERTGFIALELFLTLNGQALVAVDEEIVHIVSELAAGSLSEEALTSWVRRSMPRPEIMAAYEASHGAFAPLYNKLAK